MYVRRAMEDPLSSAAFSFVVSDIHNRFSRLHNYTTAVYNTTADLHIQCTCCYDFEDNVDPPVLAVGGAIV